MTEADRDRWNQRYRDGAYDFRPAEWLLALGPRLKPAREGARALDLACGAGRNSLHLATLAYVVDAWDISDVALGLLRDELERRRAGGRRLGVHPRQVDLDGAALPPESYDLVLDAHFLDRSLFKSMAESLRPGGLLVVMTALRTDPPKASGPHDPRHLVEPGELARAFRALELVDYVEDAGHGEVRLLARRPAGGALSAHSRVRK